MRRKKREEWLIKTIAWNKRHTQYFVSSQQFLAEINKPYTGPKKNHHRFDKKK